MQTKTISGLLKGEPKAQKFVGEGPWGTFLLWSRPSDRMASEWTMVPSVSEDFGTEVLLSYFSERMQMIPQCPSPLLVLPLSSLRFSLIFFSLIFHSGW